MISDLLGEMGDQANAFGTEVERQTEVIGNLGVKTDQTIFRIEKQNQRMNNLMK